MRVGIAAAAAAFACVTLADARAAPPSRNLDLPLAGELTNPDWLERPDGNDLSDAYPKLAMIMNLEGKASIHCKVAASGSLQDCEVTSETPKGIGFGAAALELAPRFKMKPQTLDGVPVTGGEVAIPLGFKLPDQEPDPPEPAAAVGLDGKPPSEASVAKARRLLELLGWSDRVATVVARSSEQLVQAEDPTPKGDDAAAGKAAVDAMRTAAAAIAPELVNRQARAYAAHLSEAELSQTVAFLESGAGRAFVAEQGRTDEAAGGAIAGLYRRMGKLARDSFCAKVKCLPPDASAVPRPAPKASGD